MESPEQPADPPRSGGEATGSAPVLLDIRNLCTQFPTREGLVRAVDHVSFTLHEGETLGLVGESGCGKSMTALSIMRLLPPGGVARDGQVVFEGRDLLTLPEGAMQHLRGRKMAMIFQEPMTALNPTMPIGRQIAEVLEVHLGLTGGDARSRTVDLLTQVGIPDPKRRLRDYVHQFSGGMQQRVMIAMAFACSPRLVLADEPTTALDVTIQAQILDLLRSLSQEMGMAVVMITHDLGIAAGLCDRVAVMYAGRIVEIGSVDQIFENPRHPYTWSLLASLPSLDGERNARLKAIRGLPPDLARLPNHCHFAPRCRWSVDCCQEPPIPTLEEIEPGHLAACWRRTEAIFADWATDEDGQTAHPVGATEAVSGGKRQHG